MKWSLAVGAFLSLAFAGCHGSGDNASTARAADGSAQEVSAKPQPSAPRADPTREAIPFDTTPRVQLVRAGKKPRRVLRSAVQEGVEQTITLNVTSGCEVLMQAFRAGSPSLVHSYDLWMKAAEVDDDGTASITFRIKGARAEEGTSRNPQIVRAREKALRDAVGVAGRYSLRPLGGATHVEVTAAQGGDPPSETLVDALTWSLLQLSPAFPAKPIGEGAEWTVDQAVSQGGVHVQQQTTIELVKLRNGRAELSIEAKQSAAPQRYRSLTTGAAFDLETFEGELKGSLSWVTSKVVSPQAKIAGESVENARFRPNEENQRGEATVRTERTIIVSN